LHYLRLAHIMHRFDCTDKSRDPNFEAAFVLDGYTEQFGNHPDRQRMGKVINNVELIAIPLYCKILNSEFRAEISGYNKQL
ncbi:MAG: hypothetical protein WA364_06355, partial [Candidatus Nitrosopolaris sp.]